MDTYEYTIENNTVKAIGFENNKIIYDLSSWKPEKVHYYRVLLSHKQDLEYAEAYLNQMFFQIDTSLIDGTLINSAILLLIKCFSKPTKSGRRCLDAIKVFRKYTASIGEEDLTDSFAKFYNARNMVIAHDQHDYKSNIIGLTVDTVSGNAEDIAELTIRTRYLYKQNQTILLRLLKITKKYIDEQLTSLRNEFISEYNESTTKPILNPIICENISKSTAW